MSQTTWHTASPNVLSKVADFIFRRKPLPEGEPVPELLKGSGKGVSAHEAAEKYRMRKMKQNKPMSMPRVKTSRSRIPVDIAVKLPSDSDADEADMKWAMRGFRDSDKATESTLPAQESLSSNPPIKTLKNVQTMNKSSKKSVGSLDGALHKDLFVARDSREPEDDAAVAVDDIESLSPEEKEDLIEMLMLKEAAEKGEVLDDGESPPKMEVQKAGISELPKTTRRSSAASADSDTEFKNFMADISKDGIKPEAVFNL